MSLLLLSYSWPSPHSALYFSFSRQNHCYSTIRLDYCNSVLYNIVSNDILKLQCVQNCLVRIVTRSPRFSYSVPLLKLLLFDVASFSSSVLLPIKSSVLCSSDFHLLSVPRVKTHAHVGTCAFSVVVPNLLELTPWTC